MNWTLWDAAEPSAPQKPTASTGSRPRRSQAERAALTVAATPRASGRRRKPTKRLPTMQDRYEAITREMLGRYGVRVRRWRSSMSGVAWQLRFSDGSVSRLIESPRPCGPMSAAIFLHEIGHHAIGFGVYRPRCLEEFHAWAFALREMESLGVTITEGVRRRVAESLWYAVDKARRRGLRELPAELAPFTERPPRRIRRGATGRGASR